MARPPQLFHGFVGQSRLVKLLYRQLLGAKTLGEPFPHSLFAGPSGFGKSLLAKALAVEFGSNASLAHGTHTIDELSQLFIAAKFGDFIFIDEAHNLAKPSQEFLLTVIDHGKIRRNKATAEAVGQKEDIRLERFTLVLATDQPGALRRALLNRMGRPYFLSEYTPRELKRIVEIQASNLGILLTAQATTTIAKASGGLPRDAVHLLSGLRRHFPELANQEFDKRRVRSFLSACGIEPNGLDRQMHRYLLTLNRLRTASLDAIASAIGADAAYVQGHIENRLLCLGLITIRPGGRHLSPAGEDWLANNKSP